MACAATIGILQVGIVVHAASTSDETLESQVERRLRMEANIRWHDLKVEANDGRVMLYGTVESNEERGKATDVASTVENIKEVVNRILIVPGGSQTPDVEAEINTETRDRVIEGPAGLKDRQLLP
jgi:hypothetical protein